MPFRTAFVFFALDFRRDRGVSVLDSETHLRRETDEPGRGNIAPITARSIAVADWFAT
jgi:hypothetical protein